jgi:Arc/MetJ family transcription regulator
LTKERTESDFCKNFFVKRDRNDVIPSTRSRTYNGRIETNVHSAKIMKTSIEIDAVLVADALKVTGLSFQHEVVELALKTLIQVKRQEVIRTLRGQLPWDGDLETLRTDR